MGRSQLVLYTVRVNKLCCFLECPFCKVSPHTLTLDVVIANRESLLTRTRQVVYCVNYLCIFLLNTVDKLVFYMYVFLIYVCLQNHCLRLICLSSIAHTYPINISDVNLIRPSYRVNQLGSASMCASISSSQILTLLVSRARYPVREFHDVTEYLNRAIAAILKPKTRRDENLLFSIIGPTFPTSYSNQTRS